MDKLLLSIVIFCLAASLGIYMLGRIFKNKRPPQFVPYLHGLFAAIGYGIAIFYSFGNDDWRILTSITFLSVALLGGFTLFTLDTLKRKVPKALVLIHAGAALSGLIFLIVFAAGR